MDMGASGSAAAAAAGAHLPPPPLPVPGPRVLQLSRAASVAVAAAAAVSVPGLGMAISADKPSSLLASMTLSALEKVDVEPKTGMEFSRFIADGKHELVGMGLRKKNILGLKSIVVYAFGVYADANSLKEKLGAKYTKLPAIKPEEREELLDDIVCSDAEIGVRLVIAYGNLKIGSVRSAFEESVGGRIKKYSGVEDKELLRSFTGLFKDEIKLPRGTVIDITRLPGHVLKTTITGDDLGSVQSELLCRCVFDLYIGKEPFDKAGRSAIGAGLAAMLSAASPDSS